MKAAQKEHVDAVAYWRERATRAEAEIERLRTLLSDAVNSLEYVNANFPDTGGSWTREERIRAARAALEGK